jgi:hypothetical protein
LACPLTTALGEQYLPRCGVVALGGIGGGELPVGLWQVSGAVLRQPGETVPDGQARFEMAVGEPVEQQVVGSAGRVVGEDIDL